MRILVWLDLDTIAKLYDPEGENGDSQVLNESKSKYSYFKAILECVPMGIMQSIYLQQDMCDLGLNSIIIICLYFNAVCLLYSLSNLCSSKNPNGDMQKIY